MFVYPEAEKLPSPFTLVKTYPASALPGDSSCIIPGRKEVRRYLSFDAFIRDHIFVFRIGTGRWLLDTKRCRRSVNASLPDDLTDLPHATGTVLLDGFGDPVAMKIIKAAIAAQVGLLREVYSEDPFYFRNGAVARTGRPHYSHYFRHPQTFNEEKALVDDWIDGVFIPVRRRRSKLVSAWDDIPISARNDRSWKRHRRKQWRVS